MTVQLLLVVVLGWCAAAVALGLLLCRAICWARGADPDPAVDEPASAVADVPAARREPVLLPRPRAHSELAPHEAALQLEA